MTTRVPEAEQQTSFPQVRLRQVHPLWQRLATQMATAPFRAITATATAATSATPADVVLTRRRLRRKQPPPSAVFVLVSYHEFGSAPFVVLNMVSMELSAKGRQEAEEVEEELEVEDAAGVKCYLTLETRQDCDQWFEKRRDLAAHQTHFHNIRVPIRRLVLVNQCPACQSIQRTMHAIKDHVQKSYSRSFCRLHTSGEWAGDAYSSKGCARMQGIGRLTHGDEEVMTSMSSSFA